VKPATFETLNALRDAGVGGTGTVGKKGAAPRTAPPPTRSSGKNCSPERRPAPGMAGPPRHPSAVCGGSWPTFAVPGAGSRRTL